MDLIFFNGKSNEQSSRNSNDILLESKGKMQFMYNIDVVDAATEDDREQDKEERREEKESREGKMDITGEKTCETSPGYPKSPLPWHNNQWLCHKISCQLRRELQKKMQHSPHCLVRLPGNWKITVNPNKIVQPDYTVTLTNDIQEYKENKINLTPILVFEITALSTGQEDQMMKYQLYQDAGVKYYCLVDPETQSAQVLTLNNDEPVNNNNDDESGKMSFLLGPYEVNLDFNLLFKTV